MVSVGVFSKKIFQSVKKDHQHRCQWPIIMIENIIVLSIVNSCFLLLVRAFDKLPAFKTGGEKKATSPKIKQFMPKISEIAL